MAETKCISAIKYVKTKDGYSAVFPVNTTNEVFYNIDAGITLDMYNSAIYDSAKFTVPSEPQLLQFNDASANNGDTIFVTDTNTKYIIIDKTKFGRMDAFDALPTIENGTSEPIPNRVAKYDNNGRLHSISPVRGTEVATYKFLSDNTFTRGVPVEGVQDTGGINATSLGGLPASEYVTLNQLRSVTEINSSNQITAIQGDKVRNKINIECLPHGALERCVVVNTDDDRFNLTVADVQQGDTVKVNSTQRMYFVADDSKLNVSEGYTEYTAGLASSVPWTGVTGKPTTLEGYGIDVSGSIVDASVNDDPVDTSDRSFRVLTSSDFSAATGVDVVLDNPSQIILRNTTDIDKTVMLGTEGTKFHHLELYLPNEFHDSSYFTLNGDTVGDSGLHSYDEITLTQPISIYVGFNSIVVIPNTIIAEATKTVTASNDVGFIRSDTVIDSYSKPGVHDVNTKSDIFNNYDTNTASGYFSHAGGTDTVSSGFASFAHGAGLKASNPNEVVFGSYNREVDNGLFVIGNGSGEDIEDDGTTYPGGPISMRSNAFVVDRNGNAYVTGKLVNAGGRKIYPIKDYADNEYVTKAALMDAMKSLHFGDLVTNPANMTWKDVQKVTRLGLAPFIFKVGDTLSCEHKTYGGSTNTIDWEVQGFDETIYDCTGSPQTTANTIHTMKLVTKYLIPTPIVYDCQEAGWYVSTEMPIGSYRYSDSGYIGTIYFTTIEIIPVGSQIFADKNLIGGGSYTITLKVYISRVDTIGYTINGTYTAPSSYNELSNYTDAKYIHSQSPSAEKTDDIIYWLGGTNGSDFWNRPPEAYYEHKWAENSKEGFRTNLDEEFHGVIGASEDYIKNNLSSYDGYFYSIMPQVTKESTFPTKTTKDNKETKKQYWIVKPRTVSPYRGTPYVVSTDGSTTTGGKTTENVYVVLQCYIA